MPRTRRPVGCFCDLMSEPSGCLTCTCPDCGRVGRFGAPIKHLEDCSPE